MTDDDKFALNRLEEMVEKINVRFRYYKFENPLVEISGGGSTHYGFFDDQLMRIRVYLKLDDEIDSVFNMYNYYFEMLRFKYGQPMEVQEQEAFDDLLSSRWAKGNLSVKLISPMSDLPEKEENEKDELYIDYVFKTLADDAEKVIKSIILELLSKDSDAL